MPGALVDINREALAKAEQGLFAVGDCRPYACDISDRGAVSKLAVKVEEEMGPVSLLVHNAGIVRAGELVKLDDGCIQNLIEINLLAQFWSCKAFLPSMMQREEGHIVNYAPAGGILAIPGLSAYCASKFGVIGFSDALRQEVKKYKSNVGVTCVCPNTVNTGMFEGSKTVVGTKMLTPDKVNRQVLEAIRKNRAMVAVPAFPSSSRPLS